MPTPSLQRQCGNGIFSQPGLYLPLPSMPSGYSFSNLTLLHKIWQLYIVFKLLNILDLKLMSSATTTSSLVELHTFHQESSSVCGRGRRDKHVAGHTLLSFLLFICAKLSFSTRHFIVKCDCVDVLCRCSCNIV